MRADWFKIVFYQSDQELEISIARAQLINQFGLLINRENIYYELTFKPRRIFEFKHDK